MVGLTLNTAEPVPVSSVSAVAKFALLGVAKNVETFAPSPETPVETGRPVQFVSVPDVGVPRMGVTSVGLVLNTASPVPVSSLIAAANSAEVALNVLFEKLIVLLVRV